jgi:hypothetical protein
MVSDKFAQGLELHKNFDQAHATTADRISRENNIRAFD